jgi:N-acetylglucosaminyldiphosphoundecaprenol N-acetyl-beta-D-mannosaminyltransferase
VSVQSDVDISSVRDLAVPELDSAPLVNAIPLPRRELVDGGYEPPCGGSEVEIFECCDVAVAALSMEEAVAVVRERAQVRLGGGVHLCNTYTLKLAHESAAYREMLNTDFLNLADGTPLTWVARKQGYSNMGQPTRGPGLMDAVIRDGLAWGAKHYFYGSSPEVVELLGEVLPASYEGIEIVGLESPPFRTLDDEEKAEVGSRFAASGAHYVWVGLGTPKQDNFVHEFSIGSRAVFMAVGAAFDFAAGTVKEAPSVLHGSGFEWVFRLVSEPRRLARRYVECSTLIPLLVRSAFSRRRSREVRQNSVAATGERDNVAA